jgi:hypothetical protein
MTDCPYGAADCPKVESIRDGLEKIEEKISELSIKMDDNRLQSEIRFTKLETSLKNTLVGVTLVVSCIAIVIGIIEVVI